jgi:hypothetical protein
MSSDDDEMREDYSEEKDSSQGRRRALRRAPWTPRRAAAVAAAAAASKCVQKLEAGSEEEEEEEEEEDRDKRPSRDLQGRDVRQRRHAAGEFKQPKDQGWGDLLELGLVKPGDTISLPSRGENKGRHALVQGDGKLLENGGDMWIDPVAFCVRNNGWRESYGYLKDRNRFSNCTRICKTTKEEEKLRNLKDAIRGRQSSQGDKEPPKTNLKPVKGAWVKVRCDVDQREIRWLDATLRDYNKETGEWDIKLRFCIMARKNRAGQCPGCPEGCLYHLAEDDKGWSVALCMFPLHA